MSTMRGGSKIRTFIKGGIIYIGQYFNSRSVNNTIWVDLCDDRNVHAYGYTLFGVKSSGLKMCDIASHIDRNTSIVDLTLGGELVIEGVDDI